MGDGAGGASSLGSLAQTCASTTCPHTDSLIAPSSIVRPLLLLDTNSTMSSSRSLAFQEILLRSGEP